jgi:hypothetical protein
MRHAAIAQPVSIHLVDSFGVPSRYPTVLQYDREHVTGVGGPAATLPKRHIVTDELAHDLEVASMNPRRRGVLPVTQNADRSQRRVRDRECEHAQRPRGRSSATSSRPQRSIASASWPKARPVRLRS